MKVWQHILIGNDCYSTTCSAFFLPCSSHKKRCPVIGMGIYKLVECGMPATSMVDQFCSVSTVSVGQWEFQVGPSVRISASAELWVACYILEVSASDEFPQRLLELFFHLIQNRSSSLKKKLKGLKKKLKDRMTDFQEKFPR
ncbi:uncharacterized protein LOC131236247 isoform X1 [Magnolia sinica]|uniref:uncharacterized protein LOC131236247 isoform X1 n=1 Tax=Magnolia sinica TaxID=86752 RepID=UPI0026585492|nr:uncharacterized protein LOC131236247 isoform X1 [Magnolia sinica]